MPSSPRSQRSGSGRERAEDERARTLAATPADSPGRGAGDPVPLRLQHDPRIRRRLEHPLDARPRGSARSCICRADDRPDLRRHRRICPWVHRDGRHPDLRVVRNAPLAGCARAAADRRAGSGGWCSRRLDLQALLDQPVVTLGIGSLAIGGCLAWTNANLSGTPPAFLSTLVSAGTSTFGIPVAPVVVIWGAVALVLGVFMHRTVAGRKLYATGINPRAADLALVRTSRYWVGAFAASAIFSVLVGVLLAGYAGPDQSLGDPDLFQGLAAVIVARHGVRRRARRLHPHRPRCAPAHRAGDRARRARLQRRGPADRLRGNHPRGRRRLRPGRSSPRDRL